ncbi:hypothetical protein [Leifsonia sp. NPDC077715]|uniref:hypothetical protein n=1 Tax=Leifsonia sp. NPDC077715 TaxID=3155539 RepID=UPI00342BCA91
MGRRARVIGAGAAMTVVLAGGAIALAAAAQSAGIIRPAAMCLPAPLHARPAVVHPGETVVLSSGAASCDLGYARDRLYVVVLQHRELSTPPLHVAVARDGRFETELTVPETFPRGDAVLNVTGSPYDECDDTGSHSCAGYWVPVVVE